MNTVPDPVKPRLRVYLAGKVSKDCWRHNHVESLRYAFSDSELADGEAWPILTDAIGPGVDYVGPFFTSCDHGCAHGSNQHGFVGGCIITGNLSDYQSDCTCGHTKADDWCDCYGKMNTGGRADIAARCLDAIDLADIVIALVRDDAHGTLVEVGYALGRGKKVITIKDDAGHTSDSWFAHAMPGVYNASSLDAVLASVRRTVAKSHHIALCESPIEKSFWAAMQDFPELREFVPQVKVDGGRYRLDFGHELMRVAVELDGYEFHSSKEQFIKDRQRHRELEAMGWRVIRFAGSEIHADAPGCARQLVAWMATL
jgi:very-short-patch-repair endonuclease